MHVHELTSFSVSEACQINDLDHCRDYFDALVVVSEACQINDLDHYASGNPAVIYRFRSLSDQ